MRKKTGKETKKEKPMTYKENSDIPETEWGWGESGRRRRESNTASRSSKRAGE